MNRQNIRRFKIKWSSRFTMESSIFDPLKWWLRVSDSPGYRIPLIDIIDTEKFYINCEFWGITQDEWDKLCDMAMTIKLLVDPFKRGEHMEDDLT